VSTTTLKRTPFYEFHKALGANLVDFAGFEMPVRYPVTCACTASVREGGRAVRSSRTWASSDVQPVPARSSGSSTGCVDLTTSPVSRSGTGVLYFRRCARPDGGIVRRFLLVYRAPTDHGDGGGECMRTSPKDFRVDAAAPAARREAPRIALRPEPRCSPCRDRARPTCCAVHVARRSARSSGTTGFLTGSLFGADAILSRTGYTARDGFETLLRREGDSRAGVGGADEGRALRTASNRRPSGPRDTACGLKWDTCWYGNDL
jgi:aminomethyltransferase